jgi:uncharacterized protein (TIGR02757 family)
MKLNAEELKNFLEEKTAKYNSPAFIESDPVSIPHRFTKKEDIEISAFLSSVIAWGNRKSIITNATRLMQMMDDSPHDFILRHSPSDLKPLKKFVHRTFNGNDTVYFVRSLKNIYMNHGGLGGVFREAGNNKLHNKTSSPNPFSEKRMGTHDGDDIKENALKNKRTSALFSMTSEDSVANRIHCLKKIFYSLPPHARTTKHLPDPLRNSSSKRINMFLRWMVRNDSKGVDFGLWNFLQPSQLYIPLDVHTGNVARKLGLLKRKQNDWKAVAELTSRLSTFDSTDPVKYDFALFGLGVFEKF